MDIDGGHRASKFAALTQHLIEFDSFNKDDSDQHLTISIRDWIRNTEVRRRTQVKDASTAAQVTKWRWADHVEI
ncbi:hypothetical protein C0J52_27975 [Blattella germanica]|nr:hypothetical protein C0J52_27975 [Blattella germanica]